MKFIVVAHNDIFQEEVRYYLEEILNHEVIDKAYTDNEFLALDSSNADIIIMDLEAPESNRIETVKKALWENHYLKFVAATSSIGKISLNDMIEAGFKSCILKSNLYEGLKGAIKAILNKKLLFPKDISLQGEKR